MRLIKACHDRGLAVILDVAFTHCHANHYAFRNLLDRQAASPYLDWFQILRFPVSTEDPQSYRHYWDMPMLPLTNLSSPALREHLLSVVDEWLDMGVDGLRLDAADMAPDELWRELRARVRERANPPVLIAECVSEPSDRFIDNGSADAVFDFAIHREFLDWFAVQRDSLDGFGERIEAILHRRGPNTSQRRVWLLDCHDTNRFVTEATFYWRLRLALFFLLLRAEPVWFYYGTELGLTSRQRAPQAEAAWPDRLPMMSMATQTQTKSLVRQLLFLRRQLREQGYGEALFRQGTGNLIVYERFSGQHRLAVVLNFSEQPAELPPELRGGERLASVDDEVVSDAGIMAPHGGCVLRWSADHGTHAPARPA